MAALIHWCPWCLSTTQLTMGGRKRTASYFQFGPRCPLPRMCSTSVWSALGQLPALSAKAWKQSWSVHISASAHSKSSWTRTISNTNMYIGAWLFYIECIVQGLFSSNCASIYEEVQGGRKSKPVSSIVINLYQKLSLGLHIHKFLSIKWAQEYYKLVLNILYVS